MIKRLAGLIVGVVIVALVALLQPPLGAAAPGRQPQLHFVRDSKVGADLLPHTVPGNVLTECPQGQTPSNDCYQPDTTVEPSIAVNPKNPLNIITVYQQGRISDGGDAANGYAVTFNGGRTWTRGTFPDLTAISGGPFERSSDAVVAFLPDGTAIATGDAANISSSSAGAPSSIAAWRSTDGGLRWTKPVLIAPDPGHGVEPDPVAVEDKSWIAIDRGTGPGHHYGRIYVTWFRFLCQPCATFVAYSDDGGRTWQTGPAHTGYVIEPVSEALTIPVVLPNGALGAVSEDLLAGAATGVDRLRIDIAPGAGSVPTGGPIVFTQQHEIALQHFKADRQLLEVDWMFQVTVDPHIDKAAPDGHIYVTWSDDSFRSDATNDIVLSSSDDGGVAWTKPVRVNRGPTDGNVQHFAATSAVLADGTLVVAYRQRQENANTNCAGCSPQVDTFVQASFDHGATFGAPIKVNSVTDDLGYAAYREGNAFLGDYDQIAAAGDCAYVARAEPLQINPAQSAKFPPIFHHQYIYAGEVGDAGCVR